MRTEDAYTNLVLPSVVAKLGLDTRDAAFATELAAGTIRRQGTYDAILAACIDRPLRRVEFGILDILRLGCHQLLGMRVPAHAAISSTVDLAHAKAGPGAAGFVERRAPLGGAARPRRVDRGGRARSGGVEERADGSPRRQAQPPALGGRPARRRRAR